MDQYIGKMLDNRYEILECIGTGGMAMVYKARCHRLNRLVAVKILKPELASDVDFRRRFHDESQAVAMLSNANIVSVYDVSHSDGLDYIVMELIDGLTLKQYMKKRGTPLNWREALHFITQIVRALGHAHSRGIIHRDIKPQNILVLRDGSVKVADFGIARLASAAQSTLTQEALGSVHYISPEQAKGSHVDGRSDLYSAGVVLYEMLTGRLPFDGETPVFVAIQHISAIPITPRELNPDIPMALEAITMRAMAPNPDQRYGSADEMLEDLKEFRKNPGVIITSPGNDKSADEVDEPTMVVPIARMERSARPPRETARELGSEHSRRDSRGEEKADPSPPRRGIPPIAMAVLAILLFVVGIGYFITTFLRGIFVPGEEYTVPELLGYTLEELEENPSLTENFEIEVGDTVYSEEYEEGQICEQTPEAGEKVRGGSKTIKVTISGGEEGMYMPDVYGQDARMVLEKLQNEMHLEVKQESQHSSSITEGYVISYSPIKGTQLKEGDQVTIVISLGPETETVPVPPFINVNIDQVRRQMSDLGLKVGKVDSVYSDKYDEGRVVWQSITAYTEVEAGASISFQVSMGPEPKPSIEPSPEPSEEATPPVIDNVNGLASKRSITVDLRSYTGTVSVRITVGSSTLFDGTVDVTSTGGTLTREATASGEQLVNIYINDNLVDSYTLPF